MFTIVEFTLTKEVEVVPKIWLTKDGNCWWPSNKTSIKTVKAISKCEIPNSDNYKLYPIRVLKHYETYETAAAYIEKAQEDSDLCSEPESTPKSRHLRSGKPRRLGIRYTSSSDEENDGTSMKVHGLNEIMPPPPAPPTSQEPLNKKRGKSAHITNEHRIQGVLPTPPGFPSQLATGNEIHHEQVAGPSHVLGLVDSSSVEIQTFSFSDPGFKSTTERPLATEATADLSMEMEDVTDDTTLQHASKFRSVEGNNLSLNNSTSFQSWVVRNIGIMKAQLNQMQESLDILVHDRGTAAANSFLMTETRDFDFLPVKSMDELESLYDLLLNEDKRKSLVGKLCARGGHSLSDCVRRILQRLLTNSMATHFNWIGSRGQKLGFRNTVLLNVVYDAVRSTKRMGDAQDSAMEEIIKEWLKNAQKRMNCAEKTKKVNEQCQSDGENTT